jgi:hypothetical protein
MISFTRLRVGDRVTIDMAPLVASPEATGEEHSGEILDLNSLSERIYFAPDGGSPLWVNMKWIIDVEPS